MRSEPNEENHSELEIQPKKDRKATYCISWFTSNTTRPLVSRKNVNQAQENITHMSSYNIPHALSYKACVFDHQTNDYDGAGGVPVWGGGSSAPHAAKFSEVLNPDHITE
jgi:hypothetical protein